MIKAEGLTRKYGEIVAVDDVTFQIEHGEIVGLLGHNGAGKTTIMKMITGYVEPTSGKLSVDGLDISQDRFKIQQKIGYLPENCPLYPDMTVTDFLLYAASLKGLEGDSAKASIAQAIHRTKLTSVATQRINTLSRGYRQRLGVAQAILGEPKIYILDEPTNGLDPSQIQEMRALIKELSKKATVLVSTHILQEVEATCHRVIIIRGGQVALDSSMKDLSRSSILELCLENKEGEAVAEGIESVKLISESVEDEKLHCTLEVLDADRQDEVAAELASAIIGKGLKLYSMKPQVRDLEVVFGEISRGKVEDRK